MKLDDIRDVPVLALSGRFVKDTELTRHQVFDAKQGLIQDEQTMRSSPSAFFILILNNHRLIYFPETPHAPDFNSFEATAKQFLRKRHKEYVENLHQEISARGDRVTKKLLYETHPPPTLDIIPLTNRDNIAQFMRQYEVLKRIDFRLVRPNDDIEADEILKQVREFGQELNSERTEVTIANGGGLEIEASIEAVTSATQAGNQNVKLNGVDQDGNKLSGNNEEFQISAPLQDIPRTVDDLMIRLYGVYKRLTGRGTIRAPELDREPERLADLGRHL